MTIELTNKSYILGFWFSEMKNDDDVLTVSWKEGEDSEWKVKIRYRKRNKDNDKIFDNDDEKTWYDIKVPKEKSEDELITLLDRFQKSSPLICNFQDKLIIKGDFDKFLELAETKPWMHIKSEKIH
jgi:hypothetical protein